MRILAGGCFNEIHLGHVFFLAQCKQKGELWVVLTHDKNNKKDNSRPWPVRRKNLAVLGLADEIVKGAESDFLKVVKRIKPDVIALGHDQDLPRAVADYVTATGTQLEQMKKLPGYEKNSRKVMGRVFSGRQEGAQFMAMPQYKEALREKLGQDFFAGTLNIELARESLADLLADKEEIVIDGFENKGVTYGKVLAYEIELRIHQWADNLLKLPLRLNLAKEKAWVVIPKKSGYNANIVEVIHPKKMREVFGLNDNDLVELVF